MKKRIVIALGGNALGENLVEQMEAVKITSKAIADLIEEGHEVVIVHGNGPQVGMINLAMEIAAKDEEGKIPYIPLSVCVAMSQGYIGYDLQNSLREELLNRGIKKNVSTVITQVVVDKEDEAFKNPSKPIGRFYTKEEADKLMVDGYNMKEDAGRGYRRVVASPKPLDIVEKETVLNLLESGEVVIAAGGGGIPVRRIGNQLKGVLAVIDKDFASARLAEIINADTFIILTAVEKVCINFGKPEQKELETITIDEANKYIEEKHFAPGSMLPKVQAGMQFAAQGGGKEALITLLEKAKDGIAGKTGTRIVK